MSSRNIAIQRGVYDALSREKRAGESFTEVLRRLLDQRGGPFDLIGHWGTIGVKSDRVALRALRTGGTPIR